MSAELELALQRREMPAQNAAVQTTVGRYMQEVQGMVFMAKQFPRDPFLAWQRIKEACSRKSLAEVAAYEYPRGGEKVTGPSIRLAEVLAQNWGNMSYGVIELEQRDGESTAMAFAWDLETNTRAEKIFTVKHEVQLSAKKGGGKKKLTDPRDIYELVANYGARRLRSCILSVIPKDVIDAAMEECEKTLMGQNKEPFADRLKRMLEKFKEIGVTKEMIERRVGYSIEHFTEKDYLSLGKIYTAIRDGIGTREDYFEIEPIIPQNDELRAEYEAYKAQMINQQGTLFNEGASDGPDKK